MLSRAALLPLALWIATAEAFFPWIPAGSCADGDEICLTSHQEASKRAAVPEGSSKDGFTLPLYRRRRHGGSAIPPTSVLDELDRRDNSFTIQTATTPSASNAAGISQDGTDFSYIVQAGFGSKNKPIYLLLDSGAGTTWVMGSDCTSTACGMHNSFGPDDSTSIKTTGTGFSIAYGSGTLTGKLATDSVSLADLKPTMAFGLANTTSSDFTHFPFDGILGLSMAKGVTDNFLSASSTKLFSVTLNRAGDGGNNDGEVMFGDVNKDKFTGDIAYTSVASEANGDWAIPMDDIGFDGDKAGVTGRLGYIDTGTTYVFGPTKDVAALHKQIPDAKTGDDGVTYSVPCSTTKPLTVYFGGNPYSISAKDWVGTAAKDGSCMSNIYGHEVVEGAWLLGDTFLKNVYTVFDADKTRIGFAALSSGSDKSDKSSSSAKPTKTGNSPKATGSVGSADSISISATGSVSGSASPSRTALAASSTGGVPGLTGQETTSVSAAAETTGPSGTATSASASSSQTASSPADRVQGSKFVSLVCVVAAAALAL